MNVRNLTGRCYSLGKSLVAAVLALNVGIAAASTTLDWSLSQSFSPTDRVAPVGTSVVVTNTFNQASTLASPGYVGYTEQITAGATLTRQPPPACTTPISNLVEQTATNAIRFSGWDKVDAGTCVFTTKVSATSAGTYSTTFGSYLGNPTPTPTSVSFTFWEPPRVRITTPSPMAKGASGTVVVNLSHANGTAARFNNTSVTVDLGSGLVIANGTSPTHTCPTGSITAPAGSSSVQFTGATIPSSGGQNCDLTFPVTAAKPGGYSVVAKTSNVTGNLFPEPSGPNSAMLFSPAADASTFVTVYDTQDAAYSGANKSRFWGDYDVNFYLYFNRKVSGNVAWSNGAAVRMAARLNRTELFPAPMTGQLYTGTNTADPNAWKGFAASSFNLNVQCDGGASSCDMFKASLAETGDLSDGQFFVSFGDPTAAAPNNFTGLGKCTTSGAKLFVAGEKEVGWGNVSCTFPSGSGSTTFDASGGMLITRPVGFVPGSSTGTTQTTRQPPPGFSRVLLPSQSFLFVGDGTIPADNIDVYQAGSPSRRSLIVDLKVEDPTRSSNAFSAGAYNVYVAAMVPGERVLRPVPYVIFAKPPVAAWAELSGPIPAFLQNVAVSSQDERVRIEILRDGDMSTVVGTQFYVGYGLSDAEMLQAKRYRGVYYVGQ